MGRGAFALVIRLIAGGYIIYLGYQLVNGYFHPTEETGNPEWYILLIGFAFIAIGALILIDALRKQIIGSQETEEEEATEENSGSAEIEDSQNQEDSEDKTEEKEEKYIPPQTMSIAERIRRLSADDNEEEESAEAEEPAEDTSEEKGSSEQ